MKYEFLEFKDTTLQNQVEATVGRAFLAGVDIGCAEGKRISFDNGYNLGYNECLIDYDLQEVYEDLLEDYSEADGEE